jgi:hypothetical protein
MTAVEWLIDELSKPQYPHDLRKICNQALEMEKQQMEISDEEIEKAAKEYIIKFNLDVQFYTFIDGAKWYREQLKQRK